MTDDGVRGERLDRFWDEVVRGDPDSADAGGLDPEEAAAVRTLQRWADAPIPAPARATAWRAAPARADRTHPKEHPMPTIAVIDHPRFAPAPNGRSDPHRGRPTSRPVAVALRRRIGSVVSLAAAVILLLALAGGLVAIRFGVPGSDDSRFSSIPAAQVAPDATPIPDLTSEPLLTVTFPAGALPITDEGVFIFNRYSVKPGSGIEYPDTCVPGVVVNLVESGTLSVTATGPIDVVRGPASATPDTRETVNAGIQTVLEPGDALVYRNTTGDTFAGFDSTGASRLVALQAVWFPSAACVAAPPFGMNVIWDSFDETPGIDPDRPVTLTLRRVTALAGVLVTGVEDAAVGNVPADERLVERVYVESGMLEVTGLPAADGATPQADTPVLVPGGRGDARGLDTVSLDAPPDGVRLRNAGDGPLVATVLTIQYALP